MTEVEFSRLLADLSDTAKKLNKKSDSLNNLISSCEDTLRGLNVGLEVWLDSEPLHSSAWTWGDERTGEDRQLGTEDVELGFAAVLGTWHLAIRSVRYETIDPQTSFVISPRLYDVLHTRRLLDCSRAERIAALKHLPMLVMELKRAAEAALKAIEDAEKFVK